MSKNEMTYPNFSVYYCHDGQLKKANTWGKRVALFTIQEAVECARNAHKGPRYRDARANKEMHIPVCVLRYTGPYQTDIVYAIDRYGKEIHY